MYFYNGFGDVTINVIITDINGCTTSCSIEIECQDKAQALTQTIPSNNWVSNVTTYPNPVSTDLVVQLESNKTDNTELLIVNAIGQVVKKETVNLFEGKNKFELNVSNIPDGIYFIQFTEKIVNNETIKFIKN